MMKLHMNLRSFRWLTQRAITHPRRRSCELNGEIDSQPSDNALSAWAEQTDYQVLFTADSPAGMAGTLLVKGIYTPEGAFGVLFAETNLEYPFVNARTVAIRLGCGSSLITAGSLGLRRYDLDRVEVLRGPQGTLYGDPSMGG